VPNEPVAAGGESQKLLGESNCAILCKT